MRTALKIGDTVAAQDVNDATGKIRSVVTGVITQIRAIDLTTQYLVNGRWYYERFVTGNEEGQVT